MAARVTREGGTIDVPPLAITASIRERQSPTVTSNGTDYFVTWMDYRNINWDIYGTRVLGSGASSSAVLDPSGILISGDSAFQNAPQWRRSGRTTWWSGGRTWAAGRMSTARG